MTDNFNPGGVYKYESGGGDNFDAYLKAMGVNLGKRKIAEKASPTVTITRKADGWHVITNIAFVTSEILFNFDQEFEEITPDSRLCLSVVHHEGNRWIHTQKWGKHEAEHTNVMTREFVTGGMYVTYACSHVECTRYYRRVSASPNGHSHEDESGMD